MRDPIIDAEAWYPCKQDPDTVPKLPSLQNPFIKPDKAPFHLIVMRHKSQDSHPSLIGSDFYRKSAPARVVFVLLKGFLVVKNVLGLAPGIISLRN